MKIFVALICLSLLLFTNGMVPISRDFNTHCRCLQVESRLIPADSLRSIELLPEGPHCPDIEVIACLVNGKKVCLNPESTWVKKLVHYVMEKQLHKQRRVTARRQPLI